MSRELIKRAIAEKDLDVIDASILEELAVHAYGIMQAAAASFVASVLPARTIEECNQSIVTLLGMNLLIRVEDGATPRLFANYNELGIGEEDRQSLLLKAWPYQLLGPPHSPEAMATLDALFDSERKPIYLGLEVTSHTCFRRLEQRAMDGRETYFLMPRKRHVTSERRLHYDEVFDAWKTFLRAGPRSLRENVKIYFTNRAYPHLYTSTLTVDMARYDLYEYLADTTRHGQMITVNKGSSLYDVIHEEVRRAKFSSLPAFSIWKYEFAKVILGRFWPGLLGTSIAAILLYVGSSAATLVSALLLGIAGNSIWDTLKGYIASPSKLFTDS